MCCILLYKKRRIDIFFFKTDKFVSHNKKYKDLVIKKIAEIPNLILDK